MSASFVHILGSEVPISPSVHSSPYSLEAVDLGELLPGSSALPSQYLSSWRPLTPLAKVGFKLILVPCLPLQGTERPCLPEGQGDTETLQGAIRDSTENRSGVQQVLHR